MHRYRAVLLLVGLHAVFRADALADPAAGAPGVAPSVTGGAARHVFALMDNTANGSEIDIDLAAGMSTERLSPGDALYLTKLVGQYVAPSGVGGYARLSAIGTREEGDLQNLEAGVLYQHRVDNREIALRGGVTLPTGGNALPFSSEGTLFMRPADFVVGLDRISLRLGLSPTYHGDGVVLRGDLGADVVMPDDADSDVHFIVHVNLGAAIQHGPFSASAELQFLTLLGEDDGEHYQVVGVSARYRAQQVSPFLAISMPVGNDLGGEVVIFSTGLTIAL